MKIEVDENREIVLKDVYLGIGLETKEKEFFAICMRDGGFEFTYAGKHYSANNGIITEFKSKPSNEDEVAQTNGG